MSLSVQVAALFAMTGTGMGMACIYDIYAWFRKKIHPHAAIVFLFDIGYWLFFSALVFFILVKINDGILRIPLILAIMVGSAIYFFLFSHAFMEAWEVFMKWVVTIFRILTRLIYVLVIRPIQAAFRLCISGITLTAIGLWALIYWIYKFLARISSAIIKAFKQLVLAQVQFLGKIIARLMNKKSRDE